MIPYAEILNIMTRTLAEVRAAGHDPALCVWELSPSIRQTIEDDLRERYPELPKVGNVGAFMNIPIRKGVTDEATGILLKQVWLEKWQ